MPSWATVATSVPLRLKVSAVENARPAPVLGDSFDLFNAATYALSGRVAERPEVTRDLHNIIDGTCVEMAA